MRSRLFVYFFVGIVLLSCTDKPNYVLSDKKMANVLYDLYIAEAGMQENAAVFRNDSEKKQDLLQSVFKKHKISQARFDTSLVWYNANLDRYLKVNTQVTERYDYLIDKLQARIDRAKRMEGNKIKFGELDLKDFFTPQFSLWRVDDWSDRIQEDTTAIEEFCSFRWCCEDPFPDYE